MTHETGKSMLRRSSDSRFATRYMVGAAIDIGSGDDSLSNYQHMFPLLKSVRSWDKRDGDAMTMSTVEDDSYDLVHSSHCLEHLSMPTLALLSWMKICKPGGHLIIVVPDFAQYEHYEWPSRYNAEHQWSFSIDGKTLHDHHIVLTAPDIVNTFAYGRMRLLKLELVERSYNPVWTRADQSLSPACEPAIEIICQKLSSNS
jgi:predicted SAM-dependent methyltransferase